MLKDQSKSPNHLNWIEATAENLPQYNSVTDVVVLTNLMQIKFAQAFVYLDEPETGETFCFMTDTFDTIEGVVYFIPYKEFPLPIPKVSPTLKSS